MPRVFIGNLDSRVTGRQLEGEFRAFGVIRSLWVAWKPPGYAFIDFDNRREALDAIRELNGKYDWRVELSPGSRGGGDGHGRSGGGGGRGRSGGDGFDYARECHNCGDSGGSRSSTPHRYPRSPSDGRSSRGRSPRRRSISPRRRSYNRSPPLRGRKDVKHANGDARNNSGYARIRVLSPELWPNPID